MDRKGRVGGSVAGSNKSEKVSSSQESKRLKKLLNTVASEVKLYAGYQISHISKLAEIGLALSAEKDINKLLEMIVDEARALSQADAGSLFILDSTGNCLRFEILQNDTMKTRIGGTSGVEITLLPVLLEIDGKPNYCNVSSYAALTGETVNIPDVYEAEGFDFTGTRTYDKTTGYRSKSMLVIPMKNHENDIIGILELLNAKDIDTGKVVPFSEEYVDLIASLASQAAIALTNAQLIKGLKDLFYAFTKSIATAIDEKSPYTGGHINRVVKLTMMIAERINDANEGSLAPVSFSGDELEELRLAAWMHDVGKITTPEHVVDKRTKLEAIFDRLDLINIRFDLIAGIMENESIRKKLDLISDGSNDAAILAKIDSELKERLKIIDEEKAFIAECNTPGEFMDDDRISALEGIAGKTYMINGREYPYLTDEEVNNLSIRKGNLLESERKKIENHALVTKKMLEQLPFPKNLSRVPEFAGGHHEKMDGSGYPTGLAAEEVPIQSRIMAIADVFEALTAKDRPYKKPMKLSQAVKILGYMKNDGHIDPDIFDLFMGSKIYREYADKELNPEQIDDVENSSQG